MNKLGRGGEELEDMKAAAVGVEGKTALGKKRGLAMFNRVFADGVREVSSTGIRRVIS